MADKRKVPDHFGSSQIVKRTKSGSPAPSSTALTAGSSSASNGALIHGIPRTSGLQAPIMELTGHSSEVFAVRFDPTGSNIASTGFDRSILLWQTYGECKNTRQMIGHKGAILDLQWSRDSRTVFSASADAMLASWDSESGGRIRRYIGHENVVNCVDIMRRGPEILVSGSDDASIATWDPRQKECIEFIDSGFPVTAVAVSEAGNEVYSGSVDNEIKVWDMRKKAVIYTLPGHRDIISSLSVSPDGQHLLSNSMDSTVRTWDIRAFAPTNRQVNVYEGAPAGFEKNLIRASWSPKGEKIAAGGSDGSVCVWDTMTKKMLYKLPGHAGTVNDVRFSPNAAEPVIVSGSSDRKLLLGELGI